jgi:hypothetical protein
LPSARDTGSLKHARLAADTRFRGNDVLKIDSLVPRATVPPSTGPGSLVTPVRPAEPVRPVGTPLAIAGLAAEGELAAALRRELPRQGSPMPLLANLAWLNATHDGERAALPAPVRQAVVAAWRALAELDGLARPAELERAARASGIGLERLLATADPDGVDAALAHDWKALLLRLRAALDSVPRRSASGAQPRADAPLPGRPGALPALEPAEARLAGLADVDAMAVELADEVDAAIARVTSHQLANLREPTQAPYAVVEVPLRHDRGATMLRLRLTREHTGTAGSASAPAWAIEFAVHLGTAGTLQGRVQLAGHRVAVLVASDVAAMLEALQASEGELRWQLESVGLEVERLDWRVANPPVPDAGVSWLVDERA